MFCVFTEESCVQPACALAHSAFQSCAVRVGKQRKIIQVSPKSALRTKRTGPLFIQFQQKGAEIIQHKPSTKIHKHFKQNFVIWLKEPKNLHWCIVRSHTKVIPRLYIFSVVTHIFFYLRQHTINQSKIVQGRLNCALTMLQSATASVMMVPELPAAACSRAYDMQGGATRTRRSPVSTPLYTCRRTCVARRPHARITAVRTDVSLT